MPVSRGGNPREIHDENVFGNSEWPVHRALVRSDEIAPSWEIAWDGLDVAYWRESYIPE